MYTYERKVSGRLLARCILSASRDAPRADWGCCRKSLHYRKLFLLKWRANSVSLMGGESVTATLALQGMDLCHTWALLTAASFQGQLFLHGFSVFPEYMAQSVLLVGWFVLWRSFFLSSPEDTFWVFLYNTRGPTKIFFPLILHSCFDNLFQILYMTLP